MFLYIFLCACFILTSCVLPCFSTYKTLSREFVDLRMSVQLFLVDSAIKANKQWKENRGTIWWKRRTSSTCAKRRNKVIFLFLFNKNIFQIFKRKVLCPISLLNFPFKKVKSFPWNWDPSVKGQDWKLVFLKNCY